MSRPPDPLPEELPAVFTTRQARAAGVSAGRLRANDLGRTYRGVRRRPDAVAASAARAVGNPLSNDGVTQQRVVALAQAYALVMPAGAFFAGRTAAVLRGFPVAHEGDVLMVGVHAPGRSPRRPGIRGVKVTAALAAVGMHDGL